MSSKQAKKEILYIVLSFVLLGLLSFGLLFSLIYQTKAIHSITATIYHYPLQVSNAASNLKSEILKIHANIKDIVQYTSQEEFIKLVNDTRTHEKHIEKYMSIIEKNILGAEGKKLEKDTEKLFREWKEVYDRIILLVKNDQISNAKTLSNSGKKLEYVLKLEMHASKIYEYAQNKAIGFKKESDRTYYDFEITELMTIGVFLLLFIFMTYYSVKRISKYINKNEHLKGVIDIVRSVNQLIVREKDIHKIVDESCKILASRHVFSGAWIVLLDKDNNVDYIAGTDPRADFTHLKEKIHSGWTPNCVDQTTKNGNTYSFIGKTKDNCLTCPLMDLYGGQSAFNIALKHNEEVFGYLTLSVDGKYIQYSNEIELLKEVAKDISYAIKNIELQNSVADLKEFYGNIIDSVENLIFVKDLNFHYKACNRAFEEFLDKSKNEIIGKNDYDILDKDIADFFREHDIRVLAEKKAKSNFEWVTYPDGKHVYLLTVKSPLINSSGKIVGIVGNSIDITKQKRLEDSLKAAKKRYEEAEKIGKVGSWEYLIKTGEFWGSAEAKRIYGMDEDSNVFSTQKVEGCIPERERVHQALVDLLEKGTEYNLEFEIHPYDKSPVKIIKSVANIEYDENNRPLKVIGSIQDITERKKAQKLLLESEKKFKQLMKESPSVIEIYDIDGNQIEVNHAYEVLWEIPASLTLNKFNLFKSKEVKKRGLLEYIKRAYAGESVEIPVYEFDSRGVTEAQGRGRSRKLKTRIYPLKDPHGKVKNIVITHEDVTDKEKFIEQIEQKKRELETIIKESPNPIIIHSNDGKIIMLNQAWINATGYSVQDTPTSFDFIDKVYKDEDERKRVKEHVKSLYGITSKVDEGDFTFINKNKEKLIWQFSSAPLGEIDGKRTIISSAMDITELKKKDELLIAQSRHAAMGEMIGMIAHQWRQPISVVSMIANNMLLDLAIDEFDAKNAEKYSQDILEQTEHLSKTIDDFRNFFKPDKDKSMVLMQSIIDETFTIVKDSLLNNNIEYNVQNSSTSEVEAYPREVMQVFVNVITNAKDALTQKEVKNAKIDIYIYEDDNYVDTKICDNAGGIDEKILPNIFDPYFTTKDEKTGTGLGLYMSKMIIEDHLDGIIEVSNMDDGACFIVRLPKIKRAEKGE